MARSAEAKEARRQYIKDWKQRNKDKVKQHDDAYWERKGKELAKKTAEQGGKAPA
ncbi:MAG: hypothetical protein DDT19_01518 [Syntrophomonadaceae bacterium]|nr:hypothetical protein [Bacillota bacterium]